MDSNLSLKVKEFFDELNKNEFKCKKCEKIYKGNLYHLKQHLSRVHTESAQALGLPPPPPPQQSTSRRSHNEGLYKK